MVPRSRRAAELVGAGLAGALDSRGTGLRPVCNHSIPRRLRSQLGSAAGDSYEGRRPSIWEARAAMIAISYARQLSSFR